MPVLTFAETLRVAHQRRNTPPPPRRWAYPGQLAKAVDPKSKQSAALDVIDQALVDLIETDDYDGLMVHVPPQEGKSTRVARRFPEWLLAHNPALRIAVVSYELEMALRWGRDIKMDIKLSGGLLPINIRQDSSAAGRWETPQGGGVYCVGIGGPLSGKPVDVLIIDDPVKDRAAAESETIRKSAWDWWESVAIERLGPGGKVCLISTRWHQEDLAGLIESRPGPLKWKIIKIPAIATGADDPLGRAPGEELASVRGRKEGHFRNLQAGLSPYVFSSIYQQNPTAAEGNFFRRTTFRYWRPAPSWDDGRERISLESHDPGQSAQLVTLADCWTFGTVDVAASTKTSADFTVVSAWAISVSGDLILLDRRRKQVSEHDHFAMAMPLIMRWRLQVLYVESHFFATTLITDARAAGVAIAEVTADTDKVTRAIPAASRLHAGRVWFPAETSGCECGICARLGGAWLDEWCDELAAFPKGAHDDQVDTFSYAAKIQAHEWSAPSSPPRRSQSESEVAINQAHAAATGRAGSNSHGDLDMMNTSW